jgi:hypothetical protein
VFLAAGSHTLAFDFINRVGGDKSSVLDAVTINQLPTVRISSGGILDVATQATFSMDGTYVLDINGSQSGLINANGLKINNAFLKLNVQSLSLSPCILATYTNLTGSAFASVAGLPDGYKINYNYNNAKQIVLLPPDPTIITFF